MLGRKLRALGIGFVCLLLLVACGSQRSSGAGSTKKGLKIVTSFYPVYSLVKEISGDRNEVWMVQSGAGIHDYEPSAKETAQIYDADVFVYHSQTLESWAGRLDPSLQDSKLRVIEASKGMELDKVAGLEDIEDTEGKDAKNLYDPHTKKGRSSPKSWETSIQKIEVIMRPMPKSLQNAVRPWWLNTNLSLKKRHKKPL